ncbi:hypothetical protein YC2023_025424 [Brassica napus]
MAVEYKKWYMKSFRKLSCEATTEIQKWITWARLIQAKTWLLKKKKERLLKVLGLGFWQSDKYQEAVKEKRHAPRVFLREAHRCVASSHQADGEIYKSGRHKCVCRIPYSNCRFRPFLVNGFWTWSRGCRKRTPEALQNVQASETGRSMISYHVSMIYPVAEPELFLTGIKIRWGQLTPLLPSYICPWIYHIIIDLRINRMHKELA